MEKKREDPWLYLALLYERAHRRSPSAASSFRMSRRERNYPARNAKFTGAAHKSAVIPSGQCEGRTEYGMGSCTHCGRHIVPGEDNIYTTYCLTRRVRSTRQKKKKKKGKKTRGRPGVTSLAPASSMTRQKRSLPCHVQTKCRSHIMIIDTRM